MNPILGRDQAVAYLSVGSGPMFGLPVGRIVSSLYAGLKVTVLLCSISLFTAAGTSGWMLLLLRVAVGWLGSPTLESTHHISQPRAYESENYTECQHLPSYWRLAGRTHSLWSTRNCRVGHGPSLQTDVASNNTVYWVGRRHADINWTQTRLLLSSSASSRRRPRRSSSSGVLYGRDSRSLM